jgi:two-component system chemotaxis response regulator CheY
MPEKTSSQIEQEKLMRESGLPREEIVLLYEECQEKLTEVENDLMDIAEGHAELSTALIHRMFRSFHSVKGAADYICHEPMKTLSHVAESVLALVREGTLSLDAPLAETLLQAVSRLKEMADDVDRCLEIDFRKEADALHAILNPVKPPAPVVLNLLDEAFPSPHAEQVTRKKVSSPRPLKMLVVEDDLTSRILLQDLLSRYGRCHIAINGKEAVDAFQAACQTGHGYDLICMDILMPEMDGTEALRAIRSLEEEANIHSTDGVKIFMTTNVLNMKTIAASFKALCDTYLFKPIDGEQLDEHLKSFGLIGKA